MRRKRHTPEQIIAKLPEADALLASGATIGQVCRHLEVAEASWRCDGRACPDELNSLAGLLALRLPHVGHAEHAAAVGQH